MNSKPKPKMTNKEKAISFLTLAGTGMVQEAYEAYVSSDFYITTNILQATVNH